ncbi:MAG: ABC transporter ATP-binding protein [Chthoniobacterales bacterium]
MTSLLKIENLCVRYGTIEALHGISLHVDEGEIVALIGANGAGKTTLLKTISGLLPTASGTIQFRDASIAGLPVYRVVEHGIAHVPEGRMIFTDLTVKENLAMGAYRRKKSDAMRSDQEYLFSIFPRLAERQEQIAGTLSGGEQQMLAIGRAIMSGAKFLMLDEPSLGIAPILVQTIFERLLEIRKERGLTILLVEQNANLALETCDRAYVLETGHILLEGLPGELMNNPKVKSAYLGG